MIKTVVVHSGGFDSTLCLFMAKEQFGSSQVISLSFDYNQRHRQEIVQAGFFSQTWSVEHVVIDLSCLASLTTNSLTDSSISIAKSPSGEANSLVIARNGLMAQLAALYAHKRGADSITMGVIAADGERWGYRDCNRSYIDKIEQILHLDLNNPFFSIHTPLVNLSKKEVYLEAKKRAVLSFIRANSISCYEGLPYPGCSLCPACLLQNEAMASV